jgi:D-glycero-D-manno-heptose 1,7-bisphosphate phosphatase
VSDSRAVFLDRDGTIVKDVGYISDPELVELVPGAAEALAALRARGYRLVVVSNQSGIGRGYFGCGEARAVHERVVEVLERHGVELDDAQYCPHAPDDGCDCRKPRPGLLLRAARALNLDLARSVMVGNGAVDVEAGQAAGCRTILLGDGTAWPDVVARIETWEAE